MPSLTPPRSLSRAVPLLALLGASLGGLASCSKSASFGGAKTPADIADERPVIIEHEPCDLASASAERVDLNGDGKPDRVTVLNGGQPVCSAIDLNFDGRVDRYVYFDKNGQIRRVESDYDRDGRVDEIAVYKDGVLVRKDREMNLDGKIDTWVVYKDGVRIKQDRDSDGDGKVDQWWTYPDPSKPDCAVVAKDVDGDGRPDVGPDAQMDMCQTDEDIAKAAAASAGSAAPGGSAAPAASSGAPAAPASAPSPAPAPSGSARP